jgi:hypothetical protein
LVVATVFSVAILSPSFATAGTLTVAHARLEWNDLKVHVTGGLSIDIYRSELKAASTATIDVFGNPLETRSERKSVFRDTGPEDWAHTAALLDETINYGHAIAQASTADGSLMSHAEAGWLDLNRQVLAAAGNENRAHAQAYTYMFAYTVSGAGSGTVSISIPYTISVSCSPSALGTSAASAQVTLFANAFPPNYWYAANPWVRCEQDSATAQGGGTSTNGVISRSGTMTVSRSYTFSGGSYYPYMPGIIAVTTNATATAGTVLVPEGSTLPPTLFGVAALSGLWRYRSVTRGRSAGSGESEA